MTRTLKRFALVTTAALMVLAPDCTSALKPLALAGASAVLAALTGCLSPGSNSPMQVAPAQSQGGPVSHSDPAVTNTANATPQTNVTIGSAWPAPTPPSTAPN